MYHCRSCGEIGHAPSSCKEWRDWLNKVKELSGKLGNMSALDVADAASSQWVTANSKPCPNCGYVQNYDKNTCKIYSELYHTIPVTLK